MKRARLMAVIVATCAVVVVSSGHASAQGSNTGPGNPTLLQAIRELQSSVETLQTTVNGLKTTVNTIVTNGTPPKALRYYMTKEKHQGNTALTACSTGFHMASLWEIFDPSTRQYDTTRGRTTADSGQGPPSDDLAWVRTGFTSSIGNPTGKDAATFAGRANCAVWTSNSAEEDGSFAGLHANWFFDEGTRTDPWFGSTAACSFEKFVWCAEDAK